MTASSTFRATLYRVGMNYCVDVPLSITRCWSLPRVPVALTAASESTVTTALARSEGGYRAFVRTRLRDAAGVGDGDILSIRIEPLGEELPEPDIPDDLGRALLRSKPSRAAWDALTLRQRRDFCRYLKEAKTSATRSRRLAEGLSRVREKAARRIEHGVRKK